MVKNWYVVHTYAGFENKVRENLEQTVRSQGLQEKITQVLIPTEEVVEIRDGRRSISTQKIFPGYVIVEMDFNDDTWFIVKNTPGVTGFVGSGRVPLPLSEEEVQNILSHMSETEEKPRPKVVFEAGERVKVIEGPFYNFTGYVSEINEERGRLKVMVDILGRSTPVELDFLQVEKQ
jgi:transcriptional antiterminator NusG